MAEQHESKVAVILVDHGSKLEAANEMLLDVVAVFRRVAGFEVVEAAHMELAAPTIGNAFDACVAQGATQVVVHPYFLSPGRHSTRDIPRLMAEAAERHPGVGWHVTPPLGVHEKIAQVVLARIEECAAAGYQCDYCRHTGGCAHGMALREAAAAA